MGRLHSCRPSGPGELSAEYAQCSECPHRRRGPNKAGSSARNSATARPGRRRIKLPTRCIRTSIPTGRPAGITAGAISRLTMLSSPPSGAITSSGCSKAQQYLAPTAAERISGASNIGVLGHALDDYFGGLLSDGALTPTQCGTAHTRAVAMDFLQRLHGDLPHAVVDAPADSGGLPPLAPIGLGVDVRAGASSTSPGKQLRIPDGAVAATTSTATGYASRRRSSTHFTDAGIKHCYVAYLHGRCRSTRPATSGRRARPWSPSLRTASRRPRQRV